MDNPLVSIITPTYEREDFIEEAVNSALGQTYKNIELLVIDDGSTDGTVDKLKQYESDPRFNYFYQDNQGQSTARNKGLSIAKGEFVCFLDSDNHWAKNKIEESLKLFEIYPDTDIVYANVTLIDEHGTEISTENMTRHSGNISKYLLRDNCVSFNTAMVRKKSIDEISGFDSTLRRADDYDFWLRLSAKNKFLYVPQYWAYYRVMENQISSNKDARFEANELIMNKFISKSDHQLKSKDINQSRAYFYNRRGRYYGSEGRTFEAIRDFIKAIRLYPSFKGAWRGLFKLFMQR